MNSKYPQVMMLSDKTASTVVQSLKSIFAHHGIPDEVFSDNNPFNSACICKGMELQLMHIKSNICTIAWYGRTFKSLLRQATDNSRDPYIAWLQYRNAPISDLDGLSPAQLLFSRRLKTKLPATAESLEPKTQTPRNKLIAHQEHQKQYFDRTAHNLPPLKPRDIICVHKDGMLVRNVRSNILTEQHIISHR